MTLVDQKLAAIKAAMRKEADASSYGAFISDEKINEWAIAILQTIDDVENQPASGEAVTQGQATASEDPDTI